MKISFGSKALQYYAASAFLVVVFLFASCTYKKADLTIVPVACDTSAVTYMRSVVPIMTMHCYSCHSGSASQGDGIKLDSYALLKPYATNGRLVATIEHRPGFSPMPKNAAKIEECHIAIIRTWIRNGAPNN